MFKRKKQPEVDLTTAAYQRWLRACRPQPLTWFLGLSDVEQDALADLGDEYVQDAILGIGYAVQDPEAASTGVAALAGDLNAEGDLLAKVAAAAAQRIMQGRQGAQGAAGGHRGPVAPAVPLSMSGLKDRRVNAERTRQDAKDSRRSFAGRAPDAVGADA